MRRLIVTTTARRDLAGIVAYIARSSGNTDIGRSFSRQLSGHCIRLAALPGVLGIAKPELGPDVRATSHRNYILVFRYEPGILRVLRIIEGHRDMTQHLHNGDT